MAGTARPWPRWIGLIGTLLIIVLLLVTPSLAAATSDLGNVETRQANETRVYNESSTDVQINKTGNDTLLIEIGNGSAQMAVRLNISLFKHPVRGGAIEFASIGVLSGTPILSVQFGIYYAGVADIESFLANPFKGFSIDSQTRLRLPFFDNVSQYQGES